MSPSPATSTSNGAGTISIWESRVRVDQDKGVFKVFNGDEDEQLEVEVEEEEDVESPKSGRSGESNQKGSKRTIIAVADKRKTRRSTSDSHSLPTTQQSRLLHKKQTGSVQFQSKNARSNQDGKEKVAAANNRRGPIPIKHRQITKTTGRSIAIMSKSSCNGAEVLSETSSRSYSDESRRKLELASAEKYEAAVGNCSSSALIEAPTITGNGGARDSESASEATKSAQSDGDGGSTEEETKTTELNDSEETSEIEIRAVMMKTDPHSDDENLIEKDIPVCPGEEGPEVDNEDEFKVEKKKIGSTGSDFDVEESKKNVLQLKGPISRQALSNNLSPSQVGSAKPNSFSKPATGSSSNKLPAPIRKQHPTFSRPISCPTARVSDERQERVVPQHRSQLQSLIDLVMWRDVSRSAFVFGLGTFLIISSSYSTNLDISLVSVTSYLGLIYLGVTFLYKSFINKDTATRQNYHGETGLMVGEQDVVRVMRLVLPYVNESLQKLKALFSGDPAMTLKVAVALFVMARCGGSITIWSMMKFGFFAVFTIPKLLTSHSTQITRYGTFWLRRFRDAWKSCLHKKAAAIAIFTVFWSLCSVTARIWAAFMLFVAVRYYQQSSMSVEWLEPVTANKSNACGQKQSNEPPFRRSHGHVGRAMAVDMKKTKGDPQG